MEEYGQWGDKDASFFLKNHFIPSKAIKSLRHKNLMCMKEYKEKHNQGERTIKEEESRKLLNSIKAER